MLKKTKKPKKRGVPRLRLYGTTLGYSSAKYTRPATDRTQKILHQVARRRARLYAAATPEPT